MDSEVGSLWENRAHPGDYILVTAKKRERNKRFYYTFYYIDRPDTIMSIDEYSLDKIFKKVS